MTLTRTRTHTMHCTLCVWVGCAISFGLLLNNSNANANLHVNGGNGGTVLCISDESQKYTWSRRGVVATANPLGTGWSKQDECAPSSVQVTPLGHAWASQNLGSNGNYNAYFYFDADATECQGDGWTYLTPPSASPNTSFVHMCGTDGAALGVTALGEVLRRTGVTPDTPAGTGWGVSWDGNPQPFNARAIGCTMTPTGNAWAVATDGSVAYSNSVLGDGDKWVLVSTGGSGGSSIRATWVGANDDGMVLAAVVGINQTTSALMQRMGITSTTPSGTSWHPVTTPELQHPFRSVAVDGRGEVWVTTSTKTVAAGTVVNGAASLLLVGEAGSTTDPSPGGGCIAVTASVGKPLPPPTINVLPKPSTIVAVDGQGATFATISATFVLTTTPSCGMSDVLSSALLRYTRLVALAAGVATTPVHSTTTTPPASSTSTTRARAKMKTTTTTMTYPVLNSLEIRVKDTTPMPVLLHDVDESYTLVVGTPVTMNTTTVEATLTANTVWGALRGLETFSHLIATHRMITLVNISDMPRFPYRGLMVDTARRFLPLSMLKQVVDSMSYAKLNVLHVHMTDDQSWPMHMNTFPELADKGAFSPNHTYSVADVEELVAFARLRGVRVLVEIDMPGHSSILALSKPEVLTYCPAVAPYGLGYCTLDPTRNTTWAYIEALFTELYNSSRVSDEFVFLGGDEVPTNCWGANATVLQWLQEHNISLDQMQAYFEQRLVSFVNTTLKKTPVVWQEAFQRAANPVKALGANAVIDVWQGLDVATIASATSQGLRVMVSGCWYLDKLNSDTMWGRDWINYYNCNPTSFNGSDAQKELVIGGHGAIWGEACDATNIIPRVWPRLAAVAERLWSPLISSSDIHEFAPRLHSHRCRLLSRNVGASPVGMLGDPAVDGGLTVGPGSYSYCPDDNAFAYIPPY